MLSRARFQGAWPIKRDSRCLTEACQSAKASQHRVYPRSIDTFLDRANRRASGRHEALECRKAAASSWRTWEIDTLRRVTRTVLAVISRVISWNADTWIETILHIVWPWIYRIILNLFEFNEFLIIARDSFFWKEDFRKNFVIIIFLGIIFIDGLEKMDSLSLYIFKDQLYVYIIYRRNHVKVFIYTLARTLCWFSITYISYLTISITFVIQPNTSIFNFYFSSYVRIIVHRYLYTASTSQNKLSTLQISPRILRGINQTVSIDQESANPISTPRAEFLDRRPRWSTRGRPKERTKKKNRGSICQKWQRAR